MMVLHWDVAIFLTSGVWLVIVVLALMATDRLFPRIRRSHEKRSRHEG
jgi:hypothetical protein